MLARTKIGSSFGGALAYAASDKKVNGKQVSKDRSELLHTSNLLSEDWQGIAKEMESVGDGARCKKQVWHSSLSWDGKKEQPTQAQMIEAATKYCEKIGADPNRHQIAVYQHHDTPNPHIHIYINRVPIDNGKALDTSFNFAQNLKVCKEIAQEMNFSQLPERRESLKDHLPETEKARIKVKENIKEALQNKVKNLADLSEFLAEKGIESKFKHDSKGNFVGCSFRTNEIALKGQDVGFKAKISMLNWRKIRSRNLIFQHLSSWRKL